MLLDIWQSSVAQPWEYKLQGSIVLAWPETTPTKSLRKAGCQICDGY